MRACARCVRELCRSLCVRDAFFIVEPNRSQLAMLTGLIDAGKLQPVVGAVFPIAKARQAYEHKPTRGKVVLEVAL
jgi:NADPH:quinone reductase-like Zn-dependent oxidoreductase